MTVVLCLNIPELARGGWRDPEVCKKYPGAGFLPYLRDIPDIYGSQENFVCSPENVMVVQEEENPVGMALLEKGAHGAVLFCLESPLFAPLFYDKIPELRKRFQFQFLFQGGSDQVHFPSFDQNQLKKPDPWKGRRPRFCMVTSNKHWRAYEHIAGWRDSRSWKHAVEFQLHDKRFLTIHQLSKLKVLDLYGKGWPTGMNAPEIPDGEKIDTLRRYTMGICIENTAMPGYVTEKIIDCMVAGVIPFYQGAPDISNFVPEDCFITVERFRNPSDTDAQAIIDAGQEFLRSDAGKEFSYQGVAQRISQRVSQACGSGPRPHLNLACPPPSFL